MPHVSYAQNGEDVRLWRAFRHLGGSEDFSDFTYVDVGANYPWKMSITASMYLFGARGLLVEADPDLAAELRLARPGDQVAEVAAGPGESHGGAKEQTLTFYRVPGTGLGTLDFKEAEVARSRGFDVIEQTVRSESLDQLLSKFIDDSDREIHFMSIDVEGAEAEVLGGLSLTRYRPWVLCVEAVQPGTSTPSHSTWEERLLTTGYLYTCFDGINRWYVAAEHSELRELISIPLNIIDAGQYGWRTAQLSDLDHITNLAFNRVGWQNELIQGELSSAVPISEYEKQITELSSALSLVEGSRSFRLAGSLTRVGKYFLYISQKLRSRLPSFIQGSLVRVRHVKHVTANMKHLTDPAYLGAAPEDTVNWIRPDGLPPIPPAGLSLEQFNDVDKESVGKWVADSLWDSNSQLDRRLDNHGDEIGRTRKALRTRIRLQEQFAQPSVEATEIISKERARSKILFDARALQSPAFGNRGIGRFARAALQGIKEALNNDQIVLLIDPGLNSLPAELQENLRTINRIDSDSMDDFGVFIQPSPMTGDVDAYLPVLDSTIHTIAIVFDFIPMHYPTIYLSNVATRAEYATSLDALRHYDQYICISQLAARELRKILGPLETNIDVAWPREISERVQSNTHGVNRGNESGPIVLMTGDEPRKNTFGALAAIGAATAADPDREVIVLGMAGQETRVHHWSIAAAMRPGETRTLNRVSDSEMRDLLISASLILVYSFDEGLSLPVIEAVEAGVPVIASDIPAHRELINRGKYLVNPGDVKSASKAIRKLRGNHKLAGQQLRALRKHRHLILEDVLAQAIDQHVIASPQLRSDHIHHIEVGSHAPKLRDSRRLSVGFVTPWDPQPTGVADFSTTTVSALAQMADVTVYTTSGGQIGGAPQDGHISVRNVDELVANNGKHLHDVLVVVMGNSHFHLPFLDVISLTDCIVIAHDTRMVEFYLSLRDRSGVEQLMLKSKVDLPSDSLSLPLDEQIADMRLLQNAGLWEISRRANGMILHAQSAAQRIHLETGVLPHLLPFANQRVPNHDGVELADRLAARSRLGLDQGSIHIASFGYIDIRTKMSDHVLEAAGWLTARGYRVSLHFVGAATQTEAEKLTERARSLGLHGFSITGFVTEEVFRDYLLAVDLGVQLRISPLLGVSGPLSDLAAFGTPAVASVGLAIDVDAPDYIHRLPENISSLIVAEAIEKVLSEGSASKASELQRVAYLAKKTPNIYARKLLEYLDSQVKVN